MTKQDNKSVSGTPGLGEIPFFKYFFSSQNKEVQQDEIVFLLIPHIVRESVLTRTQHGRHRHRHRQHRSSCAATIRPRPVPGADLPTRASTRPAPQPDDRCRNAAAAARPADARSRQCPPQPPGQPPAAPLPATADAASVAPATAPAASLRRARGHLSRFPPNSSQAVGSTFQVAVMLTGGQDIFSVPMQIQFDPTRAASWSTWMPATS